MIINHNSIIPDETSIWRYTNLPKLISLFEKKSLWFTRLDVLSDENEGELPVENQIDMFLDLTRRFPDMRPEEALERVSKSVSNVSKYIKFTLVNSWSITEAESYALWKIYLGNSPFGIAIKTNFGLLKQSLSIADDDINVFLIKYIKTYGEKLEEKNQDNVIGYKYEFYNYEKELRLAIKNQFIRDVASNGLKPRFDLGKYVLVDLDILLQKVVTPPKAPNWFEDVIISLVKKYNIKTEVERSTIKDRL